MIAVGLPALLLPILGLQAPAEAAPAPVVTIASSTSSACGAITGVVTRRSKGAKVRLQQWSGAWQTVQSGIVGGNKTYAFSVTVSQTTTFRVKVLKNRKIRSAVSPSLTMGPTSCSAADSARSVILQRTNSFRAANGKPALQEMAALDTIAQTWSTFMATANYFGHNIPPKTAGYWTLYPAGKRGWAENVAAGYDPASVVDAWINSPGHRANLLGDYNYVGIGYATNPGSEYGSYFTQDFAKY